MPILSKYTSHYGSSLSDMRDDLSYFASLSDFFLRELRPGIRPIGHGIVSPVDGTITECGDISEGRCIQAKGVAYAVSELIGDEDIAKRFQRGKFLTIYLAPGDYHHVHSPLRGEIQEAIHVEGALWPVNSWSVAEVPELFVINERITLPIEAENGCLALIFIGATNVGAIRLEHFSLSGNRFRFPWQRPEIRRETLSEKVSISSGERVGSFCLGSTVVLLFENGMFTPGALTKAGPIRFGTPLE